MEYAPGRSQGGGSAGLVVSSIEFLVTDRDRLRTMLRKLVRSARNTELGWRYGSNLRPTIRFLLGGKRPVGSEVEILRDLDKNGVAVVPFESLDTGVSFSDVEKEVSGLVEDQMPAILNIKESANTDHSVGRKTFNLEMFGSEVTFDPNSIFSRLALNKSFLNIADCYFRMQTRLRYYNVWYTSASVSAARESQLWHFDREDRFILKIFVYLSDVDRGAGPFTYAPGTHKKGSFSSISPAFFDEDGVRRTTDEQMSNAYPRENWRVCTGKKGSVILADTRGFHKGGEARTGDRLMFTCMFTSPASESKNLIRYPDDATFSNFERAQKAALGY